MKQKSTLKSIIKDTEQKEGVPESYPQHILWELLILEHKQNLETAHFWSIQMCDLYTKLWNEKKIYSKCIKLIQTIIKH